MCDLESISCILRAHADTGGSAAIPPFSFSVPPDVGAKKLKWSCHLDVKILFRNASTAKDCVDGIEGDWKETWHRDIHPPSPTLRFFDTLSLDALTLFFFILKKYAPVRNTNDGRRFTNKHSLDAFHPRAQNRVDAEALVNEISTNSKSALNLLSGRKGNCRG